ncbi:MULTISPECIES: MarR family transcriptional regulator [Clostridia]|uniref:GbsR/MarR family transcriptional regulator n=1 Tax=Clostridia TaxID=186801 RepID=UPI000EA355C1|nr:MULTISPECIES: MarR family transcriptional regulator [Clostridia]NBJ69142.1 MarR family transcriptional regulator [Roseburia sp. 1XD42-34]RKI79563.1 MarR family transcriptional regulator [Clostridium sp. 1xD42-85]
MNKPQSEHITNKILVEFTKTIEMFGFTPLESRLFAYLYLADKPMTLDDMAEALGKSKTAMSTSIRTLADQNLVTRVWKKGVRKSLYKAHTQLFKALMVSYMNKWVEAAHQQRSSFLEIEQQIKEMKASEAEWIQGRQVEERLLEIIEFHQEMEDLFRDMKGD